MDVNVRKSTRRLSESEMYAATEMKDERKDALLLDAII
jgi:hypothetical protein